MEAKGLRYMGMGVSGGEEGARNGEAWGKQGGGGVGSGVGAQEKGARNGEQHPNAPCHPLPPLLWHCSPQAPLAPGSPPHAG